uniref:Protocadherin beta-15-like n=1 Tax=Phallusia mammillata TaxID=59560 RepID=A0A6F9DP66_9ASCI|nr:protocadherin beta-15-like [Phallusia mammillata]
MHFDASSTLVALLVTSSCVLSAARKTVHLPEESQTGYRIGNVAEILRIIPAPKSQYQLLQENLVTTSTHPQQRRKWIGVDLRTGAITLRNRVDRERLCGESTTCIIRLQIFVSGEQKMLDLDVIVDDVNDNSPAFPVRSIEVNVSETAELGKFINLDRYLAKDKDLGNNSAITYSINHNGFFEVDQITNDMGSQSLRLKVVNELDFETVTFQQLELTAEDGGTPKRASHVPLRVKIVDANDNKPIFERKEYSVQLNENIPSGYVMTRVRAHDADTGHWGTVRYSVSKQNKALARHLVDVDAKTGDVTLNQKLDREKHDGIRIGVEARDMSSTNQKTGFTWLVIHVRDSNDNAPEIMVSLIPPGKDTTAYISEDAPEETAFAYVTATDADLGPNADVTIEIETVVPSSGEYGDDVTNRFQLDSTGLLGIATQLDREDENKYKIVLRACDKGFPKLCSNTSIDLVVLDVNDNSPIFSEPEVTVTLDEDTPVGEFVTTLQAVDGDSQNKPSFTENEYGEVVASSNGDVIYSIVHSEGTFSIEPHTGRLTLVRPLDREARDSYTLTVEARDGGVPKVLSSSCKLTVRINDVNDNSPLFTYPPEDNMTVHATIIRDDVILRIQASDYDLGPSGEVNYSIAAINGAAEIDTPVFILDSNTGDLRLNTTMSDLNNVLGSYLVTIMARDHGPTSLSSIRHINVIITDRDVLPSLFPPARAGTSPNIIIIIALASSLLLITVVVVIIFLRCRASKKQTRTYACHKVSQDDSEWSRASVSSLKHKPIDARRVVSQETDMGDTSVLWDEGNKTKTDLNLTASNTDVTNSSRNDVMMTRHLRNSTRSLGRGYSQSTCSRSNFPEKFQSVPHLLTSSSHDGDSGRGDSDPDVASCDVTYDHDISRFRSNSSHVSAKSDISDRPTNQLSRRCTELCLKYGHSDACWMPPSPYVEPPAFIDNPNSMYVQLCPLPQNHLPHPEQQRQVDLEPIPEATPIRYFAGYPASDLSSIYSNVVNATRAHPQNGYYSPMRPIIESTPRVTSFDHQTPTSSRLSPISSVSSPPASSLHADDNVQRKNHCIIRRDVAPDDIAAKSPCSAPASPRRPSTSLARSYSADLLASETSSYRGYAPPRVEVRSPASSEQNFRSDAYGQVTMRETEEIVQNIEKLLNT